MYNGYEGGVATTENNNISCKGKKRRLSGDMDTGTDNWMNRGRSFLPVRGGSDVFSTEEWKATGTSLFRPLKQDLYINIHKYDQISAAQGSFFTADEEGSFSQSLVGHVVHLWRYDKHQRNYYIALSFLFTNHQEFLRVQSFLQQV
ncbi:uncharacterized protein LOC128214510 [Mya arenaria]|uniref:uncharacterized protein LOC128214510 n=1 Tax=Mya arenaria TaxID=6604 RepID=UPI0022E460C0|nr:uncharacterized protein LOC128214510 [Mya arenaria]XP_052776971.1 uncharacterized protein LOC128214510 [Mya arenaria]XP_052776972.1 uncharacterized protein LOC128214510 [Mya arenaria]XP_052776973.1 uncharacterized protein LOC128214510 [Mya arenaria]XP_052776974.1 uncharacterized protein LOC128214510 [Mya arenaria]